ncbi:MAG: DUF1732 domain-containing protein [Desulfobacterales bacterium]|nr:DUF1732 domain-containing protein [Desulfobacterales bacterium]
MRTYNSRNLDLVPAAAARLPRPRGARPGRCIAAPPDAGPGRGPGPGRRPSDGRLPPGRGGHGARARGPHAGAEAAAGRISGSTARRPWSSWWRCGGILQDAVSRKPDVERVWPALERPVSPRLSDGAGRDARPRRARHLAQDLAARLDRIEGGLERDSRATSAGPDGHLPGAAAGAHRGADPGAGGDRPRPHRAGGRLPGGPRPTSRRSSCAPRATCSSSAASWPPPEAGGRKLNFLLQELNREFNTMGSKIGSADGGACGRGRRSPSSRRSASRFKTSNDGAAGPGGGVDRRTGVRRYGNGGGWSRHCSTSVSAARWFRNGWWRSSPRTPRR